jgi:tetratricopeptide (TPR) repeat protein
MTRRATFALFFGLILAFSAATLRAQPRTSTAVQETEDEFKVTTYKRFVDLREPNPAAAYQAAKEYMAKYSREDDQYTRYLKVWIAAYEEDERAMRLAAERADRQQQLLGSFTTKDFAKAYGLAKQVLTDNPNNLRVLIALGYGAVAASTETRNETFNADAAKYAEHAIQLIESGKTPDSDLPAGAGGVGPSLWAPFKNKEDVLSSLYYAEGFYALKPRPENAIADFIKAAQIESDRKTSPSTYYYLAVAIQNGPYKRLSEDYSKRFANQPESAESKAALANINTVMDKIIDAYARAVALASKDPQQTAAKNAWMARLTELYKFRHDGSDAGLNELVAGVLARPLPQ